jgi:hypothetical protein
MLGIKVNNEFLDLLPGTELQIEQNNPYLQFDPNILGDYSLPIELPATPKNQRLTNFAGIFQQKISNTGIDVGVYHAGFQHSIGKLKVEKSITHLNNAKKGRLPCYYLTGISSFYQDVKGKMLRDIDVGGNKTFPWGGFVFTGNSFWGHVHDVINERVSTDYVFFPVYNEDWQGNKSRTDIMNLCAWVPGAGEVHLSFATTDQKDANVIVPFPKLKYVMERAAAFVGYKLEGDILNDVDFQKIPMINFKAIDWAYMNYSFSGFLNRLKPYPNITFNLQDHLPDISISEFFLWLKNRFGWWYDFDKKNKIIRIKPLINVAQSNIKDLSKYASPVVPKKVNTDKKIYALKQNGFGALTLDATYFQGDVAHFNNLPAPTEARVAQCYLVMADNNYYICEQNEVSGVWFWNLFGYNIYNYEPAGANEDIVTGVTTPGMHHYNNYLDLIPKIDNDGVWVGRNDGDATWGIHLVFYLGLRNNRSGVKLPMATNGIYDNNGAQVTSWGLTYVCKKYDGTDAGIYARNYKKFLDTLNAYEEFEITLNLPLVEYLQLSFSDIISINNVRMYTTKIKSTLPYNGQVSIEASRI